MKRGASVPGVVVQSVLGLLELGRNGRGVAMGTARRKLCAEHGRGVPWAVECAVATETAGEAGGGIAGVAAYGREGRLGTVSLGGRHVGSREGGIGEKVARGQRGVGIEEVWWISRKEACRVHSGVDFHGWRRREYKGSW